MYIFKVMNCYAGESCYHTGKKASVIVGGGGQGALVKDCYTLATIVKSNASSGVIIGDSWGDDWSTVKHVTSTNCFSVIRPHENEGNATFTNVYTLAKPASGAGKQISAATGENGLAEMAGFDAAVWYSVKVEGAYPAFLADPYRRFSHTNTVSGGEKSLGGNILSYRGACASFKNTVYLRLTEEEYIAYLLKRNGFKKILINVIDK